MRGHVNSLDSRGSFREPSASSVKEAKRGPSKRGSLMTLTEEVIRKEHLEVYMCFVDLEMPLSRKLSE